MTDQVDAQTQANMRSWLAGEGLVEETFDLTDEEVLDRMDAHYPGGAEAYVPNEYGRVGGYGREDDGHVSMAPHGQWT